MFKKDNKHSAEYTRHYAPWLDKCALFSDVDMIPLDPNGKCPTSGPPPAPPLFGTIPPPATPLAHIWIGDLGECCVVLWYV